MQLAVCMKDQIVPAKMIRSANEMTAVLGVSVRTAT
jgi:hypothetical protein